jgi:hypothetical protein
MTAIDSDPHLPKRRRPSFGRSRAERGLDLFDTPPEALAPLFVHEPLLRDVTCIDERFCGQGNLVTAMRARGIIVHASDILDRGCPNSTVCDFFDLKRPGRNSRLLLSNPPYAVAMRCIEHAFAIGFELVIFLLKTSFLHTADRLERLHAKGHLRRVLVIAERLQNMHDASHVAKGGNLVSQPGTHAWFVFDAGYCGAATLNPVSIHQPSLRMPWETVP